MRQSASGMVGRDDTISGAAWHWYETKGKRRRASRSSRRVGQRSQRFDVGKERPQESRPSGDRYRSNVTLAGTWSLRKRWRLSRAGLPQRVLTNQSECLIDGIRGNERRLHRMGSTRPNSTILELCECPSGQPSSCPRLGLAQCAAVGVPSHAPEDGACEAPRCSSPKMLDFRAYTCKTRRCRVCGWRFQ